MKDDLSGFRQRHGFIVAFQQPDFKTLLQNLDMLANRRLRHMQSFRGAGKVTRIRDFRKYDQGLIH
jgi:hypothetical protein